MPQGVIAAGQKQKLKAAKWPGRPFSAARRPGAEAKAKAER